MSEIALTRKTPSEITLSEKKPVGKEAVYKKNDTFVYPEHITIGAYFPPLVSIYQNNPKTLPKLAFQASFLRIERHTEGDGTMMLRHMNVNVRFYCCANISSQPRFLFNTAVT